MCRRFFSLIVVLFIVMNSAYAQEEHWMPDPNLRKAVRKEMRVPEGAPIAPEDITKVVSLNAESMNITDLTGLERFVNLGDLFAARNHIQNLAPLMRLTNLTVLDLRYNTISDVSPLAGLVNLERLELWGNQIKDISALAGLVKLKILLLNDNQIEDISLLVALTELRELSVGNNWIVDLSPLSELPNTEILDAENNPGSVIWECELPRPPVVPRIQDRTYPSVFGAWGAVSNRPPVLSKLPWQEEHIAIAYFDLYLCCPEIPLDLKFKDTNAGVHLIGDFQQAKARRDALLAFNPNAKLLVEVRYYGRVKPDDYPEDWPLWLRDENGNRIMNDIWGVALVDFTLPETQRWVIDQAKAIAACGLFDGIFLDNWSEGQRLHGFRPIEAEHTARDKILQGIRAVVDDDFLIMVNANEDKIPRWAEYVNGTFMETYPILETPFENLTSLDQRIPLGYTHADILRIEQTLIWSEEHFREPRINAVHGYGLVREQEDSPDNRRWMRLFTTMSLTLSDGYVAFDNYTVGIWYDFWDADLGTPVGKKAQLYRNRDGLYIREYTNGWAVYNRSGKERKIYLPEKVSGVASGVENKHWHTIPDLDGEIFLKKTTAPVNEIKKTITPADVNNDGKVNIDDIRLVIAAIGVEPTTTTRADVNEDGTVNVVDLQIVIDNLDNPTTAEAPTLRDDLSGTFNAALLRAELLHLGTDIQQFTEAIALLKYLLASTLPEQTRLLANYPNPFNPETWIPYHLANSSNVQITIYDARGSIVRQLDLGHQREGYYTSRSRAAYWGGRNDVGERVASGVYFYQLQAENVSFLRKMLILK